MLKAANDRREEHDEYVKEHGSKISATGFGWMYSARVDGPEDSSIASCYYESQAFTNREDALEYFLKEIERLKIVGDWPKVQQLRFFCKAV